MTFWIVIVVLCLLGILFAVWPLWKGSRKLSPLVASVIVFTVALSAGMYDRIGSPGVPSGRSGSGIGDSSAPDMQDAISSLQARLAENPDDVTGWKMLGRTQMALGDFAGAADAYEKAMALEDGKVLWQFETGDSFAASPSIARGYLVIGTESGQLYAFTAPASAP